MCLATIYDLHWKNAAVAADGDKNCESALFISTKDRNLLGTSLCPSKLVTGGINHLGLIRIHKEFGWYVFLLDNIDLSQK